MAPANRRPPESGAGPRLRRPWPRRFGTVPDDPSDLAEAAHLGTVKLPAPGPVTLVGARAAAAGRPGHPGRHRAAGLLRPRRATRDSNDPTGEVGFVDSIYYTTVTLSTTGYGDIAPVTTEARMVNAFVITPLRIAFLVLLIGTTLEVLASQGREMFRVARWRKNMGQHVVVVGYGTKGRSAVETLVNNGQDREAIVVVDPSATRCRTPTPTAWPSSPATPPGARCCAAPASRAEPGHHHHRPRRLQRARHPDRPPAQPRRLDRRRGARAGERAADASSPAPTR